MRGVGSWRATAPLPALAATALLITAGCVSYAPLPAFDPRFPDNRVEDTRRILAAPRTVTAETTGWVVTSSSGAKPNVAAHRLADGAALWTAPLQALSRPEILGDLVVVSARGGKAGSAESIVALDAATGSVRWRATATEGAYLGAARSGDVVALVSSEGAQGGGARRGHLRAVDARTGAALWARDSYGVLGAPVAQGPWFVVPWDRQNLAVLDARSGVEHARLRSKDDVISWVTANDTGVFYGSDTVYAMTERSVGGRRSDSVHWQVPVTNAPGVPMIEADAFAPKAGARSARGRIRFFVRPELSKDASAIRPATDRVYFVYFRYVFAFSGAGEVVWVRALGTSVVGGAVVDDGLLVAEESGATRVLLAATGRDGWSKDAQASASASAIDTAVFAGSPPATAADSAPPDDLRRALGNLTLDADNTLAPGRAYAVHWLAKRPDPEVTGDLVDLYAQRSLPPGVRSAIENEMPSRKAGLEHLLATLERRFDFLDGTDVPPFRLVVPAVIENKRTDALAALVRHLGDHETPQADLAPIARAVVSLGDAAVVPALGEFVHRYRADSSFAKDPSALVEASRGIVLHGGADGRRDVESLGAEASTLEGLRAGIASAANKEKAQALALEKANESARAAAAREAARRASAQLPTRLSQADINGVFGAEVDAIRTCILDELTRSPDLARVRLTFVVEGNGRAHDFSFAPNTAAFTDCLAPVVAKLSFPAFRSARQAAQFTVVLASPEDPAVASAPTETADAATPWWVRERSKFIRHAEGGIGNATTPWWIPKQLAPAKPAGEPNANDEPEDTPWWIPIEE